jgi:hypothetical protein
LVEKLYDSLKAKQAALDWEDSAWEALARDEASPPTDLCKQEVQSVYQRTLDDVGGCDLSDDTLQGRYRWEKYLPTLKRLLEIMEEQQNVSSLYIFIACFYK